MQAVQTLFLSKSTCLLSYAGEVNTQPAISQAVSDVLTGYYNRKRLTQEVVAERAGMSVVTLQKKLKGRAPISATDLVILANAIGVDPAKVLNEAIEEAAGSEPPASLDDQRKKKKPSEMTDTELEGVPSAANTDPEIGHDEPDPA